VASISNPPIATSASPVSTRDPADTSGACPSVSCGAGREVVPRGWTDRDHGVASAPEGDALTAVNRGQDEMSLATGLRSASRRGSERVGVATDIVKPPGERA
jgi:hypothetical protein